VLSRSLARAGLAALAVLAGSAVAHADLTDDAARVARVWTQSGARVERLAPIFLDHGRVHTLALPAAGEPVTMAATASKPLGCLTLALLAVRTAELLVGPAVGAGHEGAADRPLGPLFTHVPEGSPRQHSAGGAAALVRCGEARAEMGRVAVELLSVRGAVELLLVRSESPLAEVSEILLERAAGPLAPHGDTGGPLEPGPLGERLARAERRARSEGAAQVVRTTMRAGAGGVGQVELPLADGCHRLDLMAEVPAVFPHRATDVDAEAHDAAGRLLARDRADVPDARLDFCLGEAGAVTVPFMGAAGTVAVILSDARWPLPAHVPAHFGVRARGGFGSALFRRHAPAPPGEPIFETLGVQGPTAVSLAIEPDRCYLAAMALVRGEARSMRLSALVGDRVARDDTAERPEGVALSFCAQGETVARFDADVRGNAPWWALVVWPLGGASP
jgi:hypothetical protein